MGAVAGYFLANDVSERVFQIERARPMDQGQGLRDASARSAPGSSPRTRSRTRRTSTSGSTVNGETRQKGNTKTMIFGVADHRLVLLAVFHHGAGRHHHHRHAAGRRRSA